MKTTNIYNRAGENYKTHKEAEERMSRVIADHHDTEFERKMAGRGPFTTKSSWCVKGDDAHGYYVEETIEK